MRRQYSAILILIIVVCLCIEMSFAQDADNSPTNLVMIYYFHGNFRCANCLKIERYTKEAVDVYFKDEVASGKVVFKEVNVDERPNRHFIDDYGLYTKSVIISLVMGGKEIKHENLAKIWEYILDATKFKNYVKSAVEGYLKEL